LEYSVTKSVVGGQTDEQKADELTADGSDQTTSAVSTTNDDDDDDEGTKIFRLSTEMKPDGRKYTIKK